MSPRRWPDTALDLVEGDVQDVVEQVNGDVVDAHVDEHGLHLANSERDLMRHYRRDDNVLTAVSAAAARA